MRQYKKVEKEIKFGKRIVLISYKGKYNKELAGFFIGIVKKLEKPLGKVMNNCDVPKEIHLNFKRGSGKLDGIYYIQKEDIAKLMIVIDVFTDGIKLTNDKIRRLDLEKNLLDTFVHEIVHNKYAKEGETRERTKKIADSLVKKFLRS